LFRRYEVYIGIDVHKDSCYITALNERGEILWEREIKTEDRRWVEEVGKESRIAMEALP